MRLLVVTVAADRSEAHLFAGLRERGFSVEVWADPKRTHPHLSALRLSPHPLAVRGRIDLAAVRAIRARLAASPVDIIYAPRNDTLAVALPAARPFRIPVVGYRGTIGHLSRWNPGDWLTYLSPRVARIACVSEAVRRYLLTFGMPPERPVTIHKGHDPAWYADNRFDRASLKLPPDTFCFGFAGNIRPVKGVDVLLDAVGSMSASRPFVLLLAGEIRDPSIEARLRDDKRLKGRVLALGYRTDAWAILGRCDAVVMPSVEREGLPRAVVEGMAQGVPAVVTDVGGLPELVRDGVEGRVVPPRDPSALRAAMEDMLADPARRARWSTAARHRIETDFHITRTIDRYTTLLRTAAAR